MTDLKVNGTVRTIASSPDKPLLWALREDCNLTGTKFGCGVGACGACTVHVGSAAVRSCVTPLSAVKGDVRTIEDLSPPGGALHPVQQAWVDEVVSQCGYCQPGQIMAAVALLAATPQPTDDQIDSKMSNLCRCGTYPRIRKAIKRAAAAMAQGAKTGGTP